MVFNWNDEKNEFLKKTRNIGFEEIVVSIEEGGVLDVLENPSPQYRNQIIIIVNHENYAYAVPAVKTDREFFLKTIFPSRKYTNKYLKNKKDDNES
ncbi:MAG: toxin [Chlorobi bacterium]|nr:toxin [Chlorobiota bacterium]MCI0716644.1 toxin [Chlorobiota bacterium]